jgi:acyl-coenzyme A synthetase/AMP-(fatty) acid ligase
MASTFAHLTGFLYGVRLPVQVGGATAVYQDVWNPEQFTELVEKHRITYTSAATPFLHDTLNTPSSATCDLSSLRLFCCFGAPIPRAIVRAARRRLPGLTVLGGWGQSENALVTLGIPGDRRRRSSSATAIRSRAWRSAWWTPTGSRCRPGTRAGCRSADRSCSPATCTGRNSPLRRTTATGSTPGTSPRSTPTAT